MDELIRTVPFIGHASVELASSLLQGNFPGTFLVRFSATTRALVFSHLARDGDGDGDGGNNDGWTVLHQRVFYDPAIVRIAQNSHDTYTFDQGYMRPDGTFKTLQELVKASPQYRYPLKLRFFENTDTPRTAGSWMFDGDLKYFVRGDKYEVALQNLTKLLFAALPQPIAEECAEQAFVWCD